MKIVSWNINGLRAVYKKGFLEWLKNSGSDIVCLQEVKLQEHNLSPEMVNPLGYKSYFNFAKRPGYSGTAVYTKNDPLSVEYKIDYGRFDDEGRMIKLEYPEFTLFNFYMPNGGEQLDSGEYKDMVYKLDVYDYLIDELRVFSDKPTIILGDFNIAHEVIDLARPKENAKNKGFLPEERAKLDRLIDNGFKDSFRMFNKESGNYTWWSQRFGVREKNLGWRIDYAFMTDPLVKKTKNAFINREVTGSDHCPTGVEIDF